MAKDLNKVMLIGRLGKDPELKFTEKGTAVCNFSLATGEVYRDENGNRVEKTEWHNITAWGKMAENIKQYLKKGSKIYCEGKLQYDSYEKDGIKRNTTKVVILDFSMLDSKPVSEKSPDTAPTASEPIKTTGDDDLPF